MYSIKTLTNKNEYYDEKFANIVNDWQHNLKILIKKINCWK